MPFAPKEEFKNPKLRRRIVQLRRDGNSWKLITTKIMSEFGVTMTLPTTRHIFETEIAKSITRSPKARDQFKADYENIHSRYENAVRWVDRLGEAIDKIYDKYGDAAPELLMKYSAIILSTSREVITQLEFIRRQQERIQINQQNYIWSPIQINLQIHKFIKEYEKQGFLRILKQLPESEKEKDKEEEEENEIEENIQESEK